MGKHGSDTFFVRGQEDRQERFGGVIRPKSSLAWAASSSRTAARMSSSVAIKRPWFAPQSRAAAMISAPVGLEEEGLVLSLGLVMVQQLRRGTCILLVGP